MQIDVFDGQWLGKTQHDAAFEMCAGSFLLIASKDNVIIIQSTQSQLSYMALMHRNTKFHPHLISKYLAWLALAVLLNRLRAILDQEQKRLYVCCTK